MKMGRTSTENHEDKPDILPTESPKQAGPLSKHQLHVVAEPEFDVKDDFEKA